MAQRERRRRLAGEVLQEHLPGERVVLVVAGQHGAEQSAVGADQWHRAVSLDAFAEQGGGDAGRDGRATGLPADEGVRVERASRALGHLAVEREQIEAVAGRKQAEELVLRHDLAVRPEPPGVDEGMAMPRRGSRREVVHAEVADEHLVRRVGAGGVPVAQVRAQVLDRLLHLAKDAERLGAEPDEAGDVGEHERHGTNDGHPFRRHGPTRSAR